MSKGRKRHIRVSRDANQRLRAAQKNAAALEAERAAKKEEAVEDDESAPLGGDQEAVDEIPEGTSPGEWDVTETDSEDDAEHLVDDTVQNVSGDGYSWEQDAPVDGDSYDSDEWEDDRPSLPVAADVVDDDFDDIDVLHGDDASDDEYEELPDSVGEDGDAEELEEEEPNSVELAKRSPVRRSAALPEGYPLVEWEVVDALGADGDWLPRWHIQANPPTLVLQETETGQQIEMKLTRKVARDLDYSIHGIMSIYEEGIAYPEPRRNPVEWGKDVWWTYLEWVKAHKFLGFITSSLTVIMLLVLVSSLVGTSLMSLLGGGFLGGEVDV